mgnify:CR=1 FL=1
MLHPSSLKIIGIVLSLIGTIILAFRVTQLLQTLCLAVKAHDLNFQMQAARADGTYQGPIIQMIGNDTHIEKAEKLGVKLLVIGFFMQIAGGACSAYALLLEH